MSRFEVLVPVKPLESAKQRLAAVLSAAQRAALMRELLEGVLRAAVGCTRVAQVWAVTADPVAAQVAAAHGARVLGDAGLGLNPALADAVQARLAAGGRSFAILAGDLPWLGRQALESLLDHAGRPGAAAIAPDQHGRGTSALAWRGPPDLTRFAFGEDSLARHVELIRPGASELTVLPPGRAFHDLDDADDLAEFSRASGPAGRAGVAA